MGFTIAAIVAVAVFVMAAVVMTIAAIRLLRAADSANKTIEMMREELIPLLQESRTTLRNVDSATGEFRDKVDRLGRMLVLIEEIIGGGAVVMAASKAAQTSSVAVKGLVETLKLGLRALRGAPK
ncbi:MAG: DUF948 domain-containing protein [Armatimonadota bacterium]|nr:DUF948 domain-containing protein [Armatimonadota bacterium]